MDSLSLKERLARVKEDFFSGVLPYDRALDEMKDIYIEMIYQQVEQELKLRGGDVKNEGD